MFSLLLTALLAGACSSSDPGSTPGSEITLAANPSELVVSGAGATVSFSVTASTDWSVYTDFDWIACKQDGSSAPGGSVTLTVMKNPGE